jgi:4-aminobutyrate aminotransferase
MVEEEASRMQNYDRPVIQTTPPGPKARALIAEDRALLSTSLSRTSEFVGVRAHGAFVEDADGNVYLDFGSGIGVNVMGHTHPRVVGAIQSQAENLIHVNSCDYYSPPQVEYARRILRLSPGDYPKRIFFSNSGAESIECAIKASKFSNGRPGMIAFVGGFHGRTMGALALTSSSPVARRRYTSSLMPDVAFAPYAYCYRCPFGQRPSTCTLECVRYLEEWVLGKVMPVEDCAALVVEPVQGAGGYIVPPRAFLQSLERICREQGILLVVDEVQTGFGKTGSLFACDTFGITPDILCLSKAIAAGLPMGATITRSPLLEWELNTHENTLGGNPVVLAAALAVLDIFEEEDLCAAAIRIGERLSRGLRALQDRFEIIGDVRSVGAMFGIEFVLDRETKEPARDVRDRIVKGCFERGLLTLGAGPSSVRLSPPLILTDEQVDTGLSIIEEVVAGAA